MRSLRAITILILLGITGNVSATHIVGGSMSLKWIGGNNYRLQLKVLRDCYNGEPPFDGAGGFGGGGAPPCYVSMFDKKTDAFIMSIDMGAPAITNLKITGPNCSNPPNACTELGVYYKTMSFNPVTYSGSEGYYFVYQRCCRNKIIQNIVAPDNAAIAVYMEVAPFHLRNSTPEFSNNPFTYLCVSNPFSYNFGFTESDGDSIAYSMTRPLNGELGPNKSSIQKSSPGPYETIQWQPGFSDTNEVNGEPSLKINAATGEVTMTPDQPGTYVAAFKIEEFRFGYKISEVRLELQFTITVCANNPFPIISYLNNDLTPNPSGIFNVTVPNKICFKIVTRDITDSVFTKISGNALTSTAIKTKPDIDDPHPNGAYLSDTIDFCWQTDCSLQQAGDQLFRVDALDNGCPLAMKSKNSFLVHVTPMPSDPATIYFRDSSGQVVNLNPPGWPQFDVQIPNKICFDVMAVDASDSVDMTISGPDFKNTDFRHRPELSTPFSFTNDKYDSSRVCWQTDCSINAPYMSLFKVKVKDRGCSPTTDSTTFAVSVQPMPIVGPPDLMCMTLATDSHTIVEYGDTTLSNPYYRNFRIYRSKDGAPFDLYDSIWSRQVKATFIDWKSYGNRTHDYAYCMAGVNKCGIEGLPSDTQYTLSNKVPTPQIQKLLTVTVENNDHIRVIWPKTWETDFARYFLYRTINGDPNFIRVADLNRITDTVYDDYAVNVQAASYCYYLIMKDTCQNYGPIGELSCSILLQGTTAPFENNIFWNPYSWWENGTQSYSIYKWDPLAPIAKLGENTPDHLTLQDINLNRKTGIYHYVVQANRNPVPIGSISGSSAVILPGSRSNNLELVQAPYLYVPNVYTPNFDGTNDDWDVHDVFVKDYELKVYNRWGQLVFTSPDKEIHWKGELQDGNIAPEGVYVYMVSYTGWDGSIHYEKGNVSLIR